MQNIDRWNLQVLRKALRTRRVVVVSGARQCGKSTLLEMFAPRNLMFEYTDF